MDVSTLYNSNSSFSFTSSENKRKTNTVELIEVLNTVLRTLFQRYQTSDVCELSLEEKIKSIQYDLKMIKYEIFSIDDDFIKDYYREVEDVVNQISLELNQIAEDWDSNKKLTNIKIEGELSIDGDNPSFKISCIDNKVNYKIEKNEYFRQYSHKLKSKEVDESNKSISFFEKLLSYFRSDLSDIKKSLINNWKEKGTVAVGGGIFADVFLDSSIPTFITIVLIVAVVKFFLDLTYAELKDKSTDSLFTQSLYIVISFILSTTICIICDNALLNIDPSISRIYKDVSTFPFLGQFLNFRWIPILLGFGYYGWGSTKIIYCLIKNEMPDKIIIENKSE